MGFVIGIILLIIVCIITINFNDGCKVLSKDIEYKEKMIIGFIGYGIVLILCYNGQLLTSNVIDKYYNVICRDLLDLLTALKILFMAGGIQMLIFLGILSKTGLIKLCEEDEEENRGKSH